jgi:radical SAM/Cys-rich protein
MGKEQLQEDRKGLEEETGIGDPFNRTLRQQGLRLVRDQTPVLQINVGLLCNQACRHCHLSAGPDRKESMDAETIRAVMAYARKCDFHTIDITGGAPELNPHIAELIEECTTAAPRVMFRSNLSALNDETKDELTDLLRHRGVVIVASFPSLNDGQADAQRGRGTFKGSIRALQRLNAVGYGQEDSGLELDLVSNPAGAFLPPSQEQTEKRFREVLKRKWGIQFNQLFSFANVPLGRFRQWLLRSGNLEAYLKKLAANFNSCAVEGLMCRTLVSVSWDGYFYDCDFNLAAGLPMGGQRVHVSEKEGPPEPGSPIAVGDHCYTCTAGAGFT